MRYSAASLIQWPIKISWREKTWLITAGEDTANTGEGQLKKQQGNGCLLTRDDMHSTQKLFCAATKVARQTLICPQGLAPSFARNLLVSIAKLKAVC